MDGGDENILLLYETYRWYQGNDAIGLRDLICCAIALLTFMVILLVLCNVNESGVGIIVGGFIYRVRIDYQDLY